MGFMFAIRLQKRDFRTVHKSAMQDLNLWKRARPEGFEPPTPGSEDQCSIR